MLLVKSDLTPPGIYGTMSVTASEPTAILGSRFARNLPGLTLFLKMNALTSTGNKMSPIDAIALLASPFFMKLDINKLVSPPTAVAKTLPAHRLKKTTAALVRMRSSPTAIIAIIAPRIISYCIWLHHTTTTGYPLLSGEVDTNQKKGYV